MKWIPRLKDLRVRAQLVLAFGVMVVLVVLSGAMVWAGTHQGALSAELARSHTRGALALGDARSALWELRSVLADFTASDDSGRRVLLDGEPKRIAAVEQALAAYGATPLGAAEATGLRAAQDSFRRLVTARARWFDLVATGQPEAAGEWMRGTLAPAASQAMQALAELVQHQEAASFETYRAEMGVLVAARWSSVTLAVIALTAAVLLAWRITVSVAAPIQQAVAAAGRIANGDLSVELHAQGRNETGQLLRSLAAMAQNLRQLAGQVASGARTVAETSAQIAQGNLELSQRTNEQAGTLEETASAMEELTATVGQNAENARKASELAAGASQVARQGGDVVGEVVRTMDGISASSGKISEIIAVIEGIAFQTNILALNAAVEAARAGDQGRGFAVVAAEVRSLAQRSATAAKEIKELILDSVGQVQAGSRLVDSAGQTMDQIVSAVHKVTKLIADIAAASREQSSGIEQVNTAVTQMDHVVQQNASLVEEAATATESMKDQAAALLDLVGRFKLDAAQPAGLAADIGEARGMALRLAAPVGRRRAA